MNKIRYDVCLCDSQNSQFVLAFHLYDQAVRHFYFYRFRAMKTCVAVYLKHHWTVALSYYCYFIQAFFQVRNSCSLLHLTVAGTEGLDISAYALKRLMNHKMNNDFTAGYIMTDVERQALLHNSKGATNEAT